MRSITSIGLISLAGACVDPVVLPNMNLDGLPAMATVTAAASRDFVEVTIDPHDAKLSGETVGPLWFRIDLTRTPDCTSACPTLALDGKTSTGNLVYGVLTYDVGPQPTPNDACPLTQEGDPLQLPRGVIAGTFTFDHIDREGAELSIDILPSFGLGFPLPNMHRVLIAPVDVTFNH
jgi:hypothetical protein